MATVTDFFIYYSTGDIKRNVRRLCSLIVKIYLSGSEYNNSALKNMPFGVWRGRRSRNILHTSCHFNKSDEYLEEGMGVLGISLKA